MALAWRGVRVRVRVWVRVRLGAHRLGVARVEAVGEVEGAVLAEATPALGPRGVVGLLTHVHEVQPAREQGDVDEGGPQPVGVERAWLGVGLGLGLRSSLGLSVGLG